MELLPVTRVPEGPEWAYEVKLDGYRAQAIHGTRLRLLSRRGKDFGSQFRETYLALASAIPVESIVDGELVALDAQGGPDFQALQNSKTSGALVVFFAFDLLTFACFRSSNAKSFCGSGESPSGRAAIPFPYPA